MRRNGYDSYHGRSRVRTFLKVLIVLLLVVLAVAVGALLWLCLLYTSDAADE